MPDEYEEDDEVDFVLGQPYLSETNARAMVSPRVNMGQNFMLRNENGQLEMHQGRDFTPLIKTKRAKELSLDQFSVIRQIGSGGTSKVYLVRNVRYQDPFAMKIITLNYLSDEKRTMQVKRE